MAFAACFQRLKDDYDCMPLHVRCIQPLHQPIRLYIVIMAESRNSSIQRTDVNTSVDSDIISPYLQRFESVPPLVHSGRTHD
jgi:hypothetical protein